MEAEHWEGPPRFGQLVEELASHLADDSFIRQATRRDSGRGRRCSDVQLHKRSIGAEHVQLMIRFLVRLTTIRVRHGTSSLGGKVTHVGHQGSHFMTVNQRSDMDQLAHVVNNDATTALGLLITRIDTANKDNVITARAAASTYCTTVQPADSKTHC